MSNILRALNIFAKMKISHRIVLIGIFPMLVAILIALMGQHFLGELLVGSTRSYSASKVMGYASSALTSQQAIFRYGESIILELERDKSVNYDDFEMEVGSLNDTLLDFSAEAASQSEITSEVQKIHETWSTLKPALEAWRGNLGPRSSVDSALKQLYELAAGSGPLVDALQSVQDAQKKQIASTYTEADLAEKTSSRVFLFTFVGLGAIAITIILAATKLGRRLSDLIAKVQGQGVSLMTASERLNKTSVDLSAASSEQAAAVQESVAAMEEMKAMAVNSSEFAAASLISTQRTSENSNSGQKTMRDLVDAINEIEASNQDLAQMNQIIAQIAKKTSLINDIVFKTQLLSVNASIEAARAGQYGKGFAVVAEEVGKLAESSGSAANEINELIGDSKERVNTIIESTRERVSNGKNIVKDATKAFGEIATSIGQVTESVKDIARAMEEQKNGIAQTSTALKEIDITSKQNYEASHSTTKLADEILHRSNRLQEVVEDFTLVINGTGAKKVITEAASDGKDGPATKPATGALELHELVGKVGNSSGASSESQVNADDHSFKRAG